MRRRRPEFRLIAFTAATVESVFDPIMDVIEQHGDVAAMHPGSRVPMRHCLASRGTVGSFSWRSGRPPDFGHVAWRSGMRALARVSPDRVAAFSCALCEAARAWWGCASYSTELERQNVSWNDRIFERVESPHRVRGSEPDRALPGLFWANYYGPAWRALLPPRVLESAAAEARDLPSGALFARMAPSPADMSNRSAIEKLDALKAELGADLFFDAADESRATRASLLLLRDCVGPIPAAVSVPGLSGPVETFVSDLFAFARERVREDVLVSPFGATLTAAGDAAFLRSFDDLLPETDVEARLPRLLDEVRAGAAARGAEWGALCHATNSPLGRMAGATSSIAVHLVGSDASVTSYRLALRAVVDEHVFEDAVADIDP